MNKQFVSIAVIAALSVGFGVGYFLSGSKLHSQMEEMETVASEPEVLFWRNPMNPAITSPVFMKDEMGMDYLPVYANEEKPKEKEWPRPARRQVRITSQ